MRFLVPAFAVLAGLATSEAAPQLAQLSRRSELFQECLATYNTSRASPLPEGGYYNPNNGTEGGSMLTIWKDGSGTPGEPINAIISGDSDPAVLCPEGFLRYATSINFGVSCLGNVDGATQWANLGDRNGDRNQGTYSGDNGVLRWNYGDTTIGTCKESILGDNHFRWYLQNGTEGLSGAIFLAVSMEESAELGHKIQLDGYNRGRDLLVGNATRRETEWSGYRFSTKVLYIEAGVLLNATSENINHPDVALPGKPVQDGRVALLTVRQLQSGDAPQSQSSAGDLHLPAFILTAATTLLTSLALL